MYEQFPFYKFNSKYIIVILFGKVIGARLRQLWNRFVVFTEWFVYLLVNESSPDPILKAAFTGPHGVKSISFLALLLLIVTLPQLRDQLAQTIQYTLSLISCLVLRRRACLHWVVDQGA